jgi:tetratricopeptide (TPR) repeat protein
LKRGARRRAARSAEEEAAAPAPSPLPSRAALGVVGAALLARLVVLGQLHGDPLLQPTGVLDPAVYVQLARRAAGGDWALGPDVYYVSPLYVYVLAVVFRLGLSTLAAQVLQVALGAAAVGLVVATARRLYGERAGLWAGGLAALCGVFAFHEVLLLQSALDPFLAALALHELSRLVVAPSPRAGLRAGLAFGVLGLNRPNALPALALVAAVALAVAAARRSRPLLLAAVALGVGGALAVAPVALRNRAVAGEWVAVSSHGGLNFLIGNSASADGTYQAPPGIAPSIEGQREDARRVAEAGLGRPATSTEVSSWFYGQAWSWIRSQPAAAAALLLRKLHLVLHRSELALNYSYAYWSREEPTLLQLLVVGPWLLVPLGLLGLFAPRAPEVPRDRYLVFVTFVPAYALAVAAFFVSSRYRLPLLVALCVTAGGALAALPGLRLAPRARLAVGLALAAVVALANWPLKIDEGRADERAERVLHLVAAGRGAEAEVGIARTVAEHRDPALFLWRVGRAYLESGRPADALPYLADAARRSPGQPDILLSQAQALVSSGRGAEAVSALRQVPAPVGDPDLAEPLGQLAASLGAFDLAVPWLAEAAGRPGAGAEAHYNLALALARTGRLEAARDSARRARDRAPDDAQVASLLADLEAALAAPRPRP